MGRVYKAPNPQLELVRGDADGSPFIGQVVSMGGHSWQGPCAVNLGLSVQHSLRDSPPWGHRGAAGTQSIPCWDPTTPNPASPASRWYAMSSPLAKDTKTWLSRYLWEETSFERCCRAAPNPSRGSQKPPARLQDAHDGGGVLHLHAVLPVADVIRGLVHVDAAETRQKEGVEAPLKPGGASIEVPPRRARTSRPRCPTTWSSGRLRGRGSAGPRGCPG